MIALVIFYVSLTVAFHNLSIQLLNHLTSFGPFLKAISGNRASALLDVEGKVYQFGKLTTYCTHWTK